MNHNSDDFLEISLIKQGKLELQKSVFELAPVIEGAIDFVDSVTRDRPRTLEVTKIAEPVYVFADQQRIRQVIARLLLNASMLTDARGLIRLDMQLDGDHVVISVVDDGAGIEQAQLPCVFDTSFRVERSGEPAIGLSLPLVRALIEMHGGDVTVSSEGSGTGSSVSIRLPVTTGGE